MKKYIIYVLILFNQSIFAQTIVDSLKNENQQLNKLLQEQGQKIEKLAEQIDTQNNIADAAGKVIDWSAMIFGLFVIILGFAGWFAGNKFAKIDELRPCLKILFGQSGYTV